MRTVDTGRAICPCGYMLRYVESFVGYVLTTRYFDQGRLLDACPSCGVRFTRAYGMKHLSDRKPVEISAHAMMKAGK